MATLTRNLYTSAGGKVDFAYDSVTEVISTVTINVNAGQTLHISLVNRQTNATLTGTFTPSGSAEVPTWSNGVALNVSSQGILYDRATGFSTFTATVW